MDVRRISSHLITIIASLLMGASFLTGMTLEDTQGRTLEAKDIRVTGESVTFTRADSGHEFTVPMGTFSESTREAIAGLIAEESLRALLPVPGTTEGYAPTPDIRVLDVTGDEIVYEIPERIEVRQGDPFEFVNQAKLSNVFDDFQNAINNKDERGLEGHWLSLKDGEKIRITGPRAYEISVSAQGPLTLNRDEASPEWDAHIRAYQIRETELMEAIKNMTPLYEMTDTDRAFDHWITQWYVENFFRHPEVPMALVGRLLSDPELRVEYLDAVTFPEDLKNRSAHIEGMGHFGAPAKADDLDESRRITAEIAREFPEEIQANTRLALALSLIHDAGADYTTSTFGSLKYGMPQKGWLRSHLEVFEWKTRPGNIRDFVFKNEDLTVRQQTWANGTSQTPENLDWAKKKPFNSNLDTMYTLTAYGAGTWGRYHDIRKLDLVKAVCVGQAHVLHERLIAWNVPNAYCSGATNKRSHAYIWALIPQGAKSGGAWDQSNGSTIEPTNNLHVTDGIFAILVGWEYNSPLRQKLRVKTRYASTLEGNARKEVIKDILSENGEFAPAHILQMEEGIPEVGFKNPLDHMLFHQALVWKHAENGDSEKAAEALHLMVEGETDPVQRIGWTLQTWANIGDIHMKLALMPEFGKISPDYPGTIQLMVTKQLNHALIYKPLPDVTYPEMEAFEEAKQALFRNGRKKNRDFRKILEMPRY